MEAIFACWRLEIKSKGDKISHLTTLASEGLELFKKFGAKDIGFYKPRYYVFSGLYQHLSTSDFEKSNPFFQESIKISENLSLPYELAIAKLELAKCSTSPSIRSSNLRRASEIFEVCDSPFELCECYSELQVNCIGNTGLESISFASEQFSLPR